MLLAKILIISVFGLCGAQKLLPNVDFVGRGYDIFRSVPRPADGGVDPGYTEQIVQMKSSANSKKKSSDGRYLLPDASQVFDCLSCRFTLDVQTIQDTYEYAKTYEDKVEKGTSVSFASGQASPDFGNVAHTTSADQRTLVDASLSCIVYCADLPIYALKAHQFNEQFVKAVERLNVTDPDTFNEFMYKFGTHVVYSTRMGSAYWQRSTFHNLDWPKAVSSVNDRIKRAMEIDMVDGWADMSSDEVQMARKLKNYATERFTHQIGAPFSPNSSWITETRQNPMPVALSIVPVSELMRKRIFPDDAEINEKREIINNYITGGVYCNFLFQKLGLQGECQSENALMPQDITRFVSNPQTISSCSGGSRLPAFGGVYVDGLFPAVTNYRSNRYECSPSHKYSENAAVSITENGATRGRVVYCAIGSDDQEGLFAGLSSETFYVGDCGTTNGGSRYYEPFPADLVRFSTQSVAVYNPYVASTSRGCPKHFQRHPLASLTVAERPTSNGRTCRQAVNVFVCFNPVEYFDGAFLGGFYTEWESDKHTKIINPVTKTATCPKGYEPKLLIIGTDDGRHRAYACVINGSP